jgi:hypothetical protein
MPGKRNDVEEESAADRETAFTRVILVWAFVLVIMFWITSTPPPTVGRSVPLWICGSLVQGSLDGGDPSTQSEGESEERTEMIRASLAMPQVFDVARRMMREAWADAKPLEMTATFGDEDCKAWLTMRMVFVAAETRDRYAKKYGSIEGEKQTLERLAKHLSARLAVKAKGEVR